MTADSSTPAPGIDTRGPIAGAGRLRFTGLFAVGTLWLSLGVGSALAGFDLLGHRPLSHLGVRPSSDLLFSAGLAAAAVLFIAFHGYVRWRFPTSLGFSVAMVGGMAAQVVAAFVPVEGSALDHRVHTVSALALGASLPLFMWRFAAAQPAGPLRRTAVRLAKAEVAACVLGVWLSRGGVAPLAEIVPAAVFHAWVAVLTLWPGTGRAPGPPSVEVDGAEVPQLVEVVAGVDAPHRAGLGPHHQ